MAKTHGPLFDFGDVPEKVKKAIDVLTIKSIAIQDNFILEWAKKIISDEEIRRLGIIARSYGLDLSDENAGLALALELARELKGFRVLARGKGNPRNVAERHGEFYYNVQFEMMTKNVKLSQAISNVARKAGVTQTEAENAYHRVSKAEKNDVKKILDAYRFVEGVPLG